MAHLPNYDWFANCETTHFGGAWRRILQGGGFPIGFVTDRSVQENVLPFISSFDESIVDFEIEEIKKIDEGLLGKTYVIHTIHKLPDGSGFQSILLGNESSGTRKMLALYEPFKYVLEHGIVLFIDDLKAYVKKYLSVKNANS